MDEAWLRRARSRHATRIRDHSRIPRAIAERLIEHLEPVRLEPEWVLEPGAGAGFLTELLQRRFPAARIVALDDVPALLPRWAPRLRLPWRSPPRLTALCAHPGALPLARASVDAVCANLPLGLLTQGTALLGECRRVLRHGGLLMVSFLGPDSLVELRRSLADLDRHPRLADFPDMHDVADAVVSAGFSDVVADSERIHAEFDHVDHLLAELRAVGGGNALAVRSRGLTSPRLIHALRERYPHDSDGSCLATLELGFVHAWAVDPPMTPVSLPRRSG